MNSQIVVNLELLHNHADEPCFFLKIGDDAYGGKITNLPALQAAINAAVQAAYRGGVVTVGSYPAGLRNEALRECRY